MRGGIFPLSRGADLTQLSKEGQENISGTWQECVQERQLSEQERPDVAKQGMLELETPQNPSLGVREAKRCALSSAQRLRERRADPPRRPRPDDVQPGLLLPCALWGWGVGDIETATRGQETQFILNLTFRTPGCEMGGKGAPGPLHSPLLSCSYQAASSCPAPSPRPWLSRDTRAFPAAAALLSSLSSFLMLSSLLSTRSFPSRPLPSGSATGIK